MTDVWHIIGPNEPVRCPARLPDGRICNRAQDVVAHDTFVRVRLQPTTALASPGSLLRICRNTECGARLEVNVAPTVSVR